MSYAGDVSCNECWEALKGDATAQLVDVRTMPEWNFVGLPELALMGKQAICADWQQFPTMQVNPEFVEAVETHVNNAGADKNSKVFLLCRSGVRSIAAAQALTAAGFTQAFNVVGGFEGDMDEDGHRGNRAGWKFDQLPWKQR